MTQFIPFSRDQAFLLPPDAKDWLPADDVTHFVVAAVDRVPLGAFAVRPIPGGKAQYHPRLLLALLIYCYANGILSSRRIERATHCDIGVRYVAANLHPDHDTIAVFRRANRAAFEAAFLQVLLLAKESGLLRLGTVAINGTKLDADASKIRSVRYDRANELRAKLAADIAELTAEAEAADAVPDPQALPKEIARREALKARLDAACARLEAQARAEAAAAQPEYEAKQAAHDARQGRRRPPKAPKGTPPATRQSNLTDPESPLMRRSDAHEYRLSCTRFPWTALFRCNIRKITCDMNGLEGRKAVYGPVVSEGGRSPSTLSRGHARPLAAEGAAVAPLGPGQRWSARRKRVVVLRLLAGDSVELLSRELGLPVIKLEQWRQKAEAAPDGALKGRDADAAEDGQLAAALRRVDELGLENELLRARIERPGPLGRRRSQ